MYIHSLVLIRYLSPSPVLSTKTIGFSSPFSWMYLRPNSEKMQKKKKNDWSTLNSPIKKTNINTSFYKRTFLWETFIRGENFFFIKKYFSFPFPLNHDIISFNLTCYTKISIKNTRTSATQFFFFCWVLFKIFLNLQYQ